MFDDESTTILIIDDDEITLEILSEILRSLGHEVVTAASGEEGLTLFREQAPDAVIVDLIMPGIGGMEVLKAVAEHSDEVPAICISGTSVIQDAVTAIQNGAWDYLIKPIQDAAIIEHTLNKALERARLIRDNRHYREELEEEVEIRTQELVMAIEALKKEIDSRKKTQDELVRAKEEAESANKAKSQFLANMSHELKTPLNGVIGMAQLELSKAVKRGDDEARENLEVIKQSGQGLLSILNNLLDVSAVETGRLYLEAYAFSLREVVDQLAAVMGVQAQWKKLDLKAEVAETVPDNLVGDPGRLKQVLTNLVSNALTHTERGGVTLRVTEADDPSQLGREPVEGEVALRFDVIDTGLGVAKEKQASIFEAFAVGEHFLTKRRGGAGLGLSISKAIVDKMGGAIMVDSEEGKGSTFSFTAIIAVA